METKSYNSLGGTIGSLYVPWNAVLHKVNPSDTTKLKKKTRHNKGEREGGKIKVLPNLVDVNKLPCQK